jgi:prepilin-type N-terminal cleavage/methylation domain-containing protein
MKQKGFTLLEILLVIAAIGILAAIVIVAINPNRQLAQVRNIARKSDINTLFSALSQYNLENEDYPSTIENLTEDTIIEICDPEVDQTTCQNESLLYLGDLVPNYIAAIPNDPTRTGNGAGYVFEYDVETQKYAIRSTAYENQELIRLGPDLSLVENGLLAYWSFEETEGSSITDTSGNQNNLVINGGFTFENQSTPGVIGNAIDLDGIDDYFAMSTGIGSGDISVSVWIKKPVQDGLYDTIASTTRFRVTNRPRTSAQYESLVDSGEGSSNFVLAGAVSYNVWQHVVIVQEGVTLRLYRNNILRDTYNVSGITPANDIELGRNGLSGIGDNTDFFDGAMDELRIYNRALTLDEIEVLNSMRK